MEKSLRRDLCTICGPYTWPLPLNTFGAKIPDIDVRDMILTSERLLDRWISSHSPIRPSPFIGPCTTNSHIKVSEQPSSIATVAARLPVPMAGSSFTSSSLSLSTVPNFVLDPPAVELLEPSPELSTTPSSSDLLQLRPPIALQPKLRALNVESRQVKATKVKKSQRQSVRASPYQTRSRTAEHRPSKGKENTCA
jgi:hypothetical protein